MVSYELSQLRCPRSQQPLSALVDEALKIVFLDINCCYLLGLLMTITMLKLGHSNPAIWNVVTLSQCTYHYDHNT